MANPLVYHDFMSRTVVVFLSLLMMLSGCSSTPGTMTPLPDLYIDHKFEQPENWIIETPTDIFRIDDVIKTHIDQTIRPITHPKARTQTLVNQLFNETDQSLLYDNFANLTATQAWHQRRANCLTLTILAWSMAEQADLTMNFQEIEIPEYWVHQEGFNLLNSHVNLRVVGANIDGEDEALGKDLVVDFDPYSPKKIFPSTVISKQRIIAMFYNNKGAEALVNEQLDKAYFYLKAATLQDPAYHTPWGNLGLVYRVRGLMDYAESAYQHALILKPDNLTVLDNLQILFRKTGRYQAAEQLAQRIDRKRQQNPWYHYMQGNVAFNNGRWQQAIDHYKRAIRFDDSIHSFYHGLAKSYFKLGELALARRYMRQARQHAVVDDAILRYQQKLDVLKQQ